MREIHKILKSATVEDLLRQERGVLCEYSSLPLFFKRYFVSDETQASGLLKAASDNVSIIIQPVLDEGYTCAVWLWLGAEGLSSSGVFWRSNLSAPRAGGSIAEDSESQTREILERYEDELRERGMSIAENCVRTWFFVHDIDNNYAGVVKARRENFEREGMTRHTHYLASTGIQGTSPSAGGGPASGRSLVQLDAIALKGNFTQRYLYAPENFSPTHDYGVTFERGVLIETRACSYALISGTASIDKRGEIVHPGDVSAQTFRMWQNVEALLDEAGCRWEHVCSIIVYLRNADDYAVVAPLFAERFPLIPFVFTLAPVCRPGWLIEMECVACVCPGDK